MSTHTPQSRIETARELAKLKNDKPDTPKKIERPADAIPDANGRVMQRNEGKWIWKFACVDDKLSLDIEISKFLDTSLIEVDVKSTYIRILIKNKLLQLMLPERVLEGEEYTICERSRLTGHLLVAMTRENPLPKLDLKDEKSEVLVVTHPRNRRLQRLSITPLSESPSKRLSGAAAGEKIRDRKYVASDVRKEIPEDFIDNPDVPPLC